MSTRAPAVEARQLIKTYPGDVTALNGMDITVERRHGLRTARPQRRRQVHHRQDPHHPRPPRLRHRDRRRTRRRCATPTGSAARSASSLRSPAPTPSPPAGRTCCSRAGSTGCGAPRSHRRADELLDRFDLADAAERQVKGVLRRHAAPPRRGARPGPPARGALPRRADHRTRPRGAHRDVGGDLPAGRRRGADDPAHHALPGGGRPARRAHRDRRPRPDRRRGHPRRAEGRTARRRRPHGAARRAGEPTALLDGRADRSSPGVHEVLVDGRRVSVRADDGRRRRARTARRPGAGRVRRSPPRPSPAPRSTTSICATPGRRFSEAEAG